MNKYGRADLLIDLLNEKGKNLIKLKDDYEKIPQGIMKEVSKEGLEKMLKKDYTPTMIKNFFELDYLALLDKLLKTKSMRREDNDILKERYNEFMNLNLNTLNNDILNNFQSNDLAKKIRNILGSNITSGLRVIFVENLHKVQLVEQDGAFYILKKAGLRYPTFRNFKGASGDLFKNIGFMTNFISSYHRVILNMNINSIVLGNVEVNEKYLNSSNYKSEVHSAYSFDVLIPLNITDSVEDITEKVLEVNTELYNLGIL